VPSWVVNWVELEDPLSKAAGASAPITFDTLASRIELKCPRYLNQFEHCQSLRAGAWLQAPVLFSAAAPSPRPNISKSKKTAEL